MVPVHWPSLDLPATSCFSLDSPVCSSLPRLYKSQQRPEPESSAAALHGSRLHQLSQRQDQNLGVMQVVTSTLPLPLSPCLLCCRWPSHAGNSLLRRFLCVSLWRRRCHQPHVCGGVPPARAACCGQLNSPSASTALVAGVGVERATALFAYQGLTLPWVQDAVKSL